MQPQPRGAACQRTAPAPQQQQSSGTRTVRWGQASLLPSLTSSVSQGGMRLRANLGSI